jgi:hypothetical protein
MKFLSAQESDFLKLKSRAEKLQEYQGIAIIYDCYHFIIMFMIMTMIIIIVRYLKTSCR